MKTLERLLIVVFFITATSMTFAQTFAVKAGLNLSNQIWKDNTTTYSTDYKMNPGFNVGATVDFPIGEIFSIEPGLFLTTKGFKYEYSEEYHPYGTVDYMLQLNAYYFDIPVNLKASFNAGNIKIYGLFGPYLGIGLSGKMIGEVTYEGETEKDEEFIYWGSDANEDDLKRLDYGLTFGAGVEFSSILIEVNYGLGLANISAYTDYDSKINNRVLGISAGYRFGGK